MKQLNNKNVLIRTRKRTVHDFFGSDLDEAMVEVLDEQTYQDVLLSNL